MMPISPSIPVNPVRVATVGAAVQISQIKLMRLIYNVYTNLLNIYFYDICLLECTFNSSLYTEIKSFRFSSFDTAR